jgi:hypothetical protein
MSVEEIPHVWCFFVGCLLGAHRAIDYSFEGQDSYQFGLGSSGFLNLLFVWFPANDKEVGLFCDRGDVSPPMLCYQTLQGIIAHIRMAYGSQLWSQSIRNL